MLAQAVATLRQQDGTPRSFPVRGDETGPPLIFHLVPIRREAHDLFAAAAGVLVATPVQQSGTPAASMLQGLFDLSPTEARVARKIAGGQNIEAVAAALGTSRETVRHHLKVVFQKTGTNRQAELVLLLSGAKGFTAA
ncbi:LuxR family transcriptional regulator [Oleomonas cavernae]|nr:helix-turn-helix transcriptional regulator [Oleomonas cavernae]RJF86410.1 LuxR family transcriptional regulator [Oleomonas cavernae]